MNTSSTLVEPARQAWRSWCDSARDQGLTVPVDPAIVDSVLRVWEASQFVSKNCLLHPRVLAELAESGDLRRSLRPLELEQRLRSCLAEVTDLPSLQQALRRFRRYHMLRIVWRDLARWAPLAETMEDLSALADACLEEALRILYRQASEEFGIPRSPQGEQQHLIVLGMGKLGARELNLSSDIDLIFAYPQGGETEAKRPLANEQFFTRLCQRLVQAVDTPTVDGFVFRVDTRLRPYGDSGPLVMSFDALEDYYQSQAREWERYAMIKARVVAGDQPAGAALQDMLRPFVYRRYLDFGAIESLRGMKAMISGELKRKGMADNIKLGPGGIREIEFIGQAFQLIRGGRDIELQIRPILAVLDRLREKGYLPAHVAEELSGAYEFLRLLENRLQAWADRQTHVLPEDELARLRLARSMGFASWEALSRALEHHREAVQSHFDKVFAASRAEKPGRAGIAALWQEQAPSAAIKQLAVAGFADPEAAWDELVRFRESRPCRSLSARGRERLDQLMPLLLEGAAELEHPETALARLLRLLEAVVRRTAYIALLVENPDALAQLLRLSSVSPWISSLLTRYPLLMDELLDPRRLYAPQHRSELEQELGDLLSHVEPEDLEQQMERLRQFAQSNILRVASADITGAIPLMVVSDYLTEIAEAVLGRVMQLAWGHLVGKHGRPTQVLGGKSSFAVVGYGKLGGIELGYGSDLDLVFLHGGQELGAQTDGPSPLANDVFYARLGRRIIHMLNTQTPSGVLYEVDMRLRPNGNAGMLVSSLGAFDEYQSEEAWTWEHQALIRARVVAGDPAVKQSFAEIRRRVLLREREPQQLREEVRDMRRRMRQELDKTGAGQFDLKQGAGGIADIEFMVQYLILRWAHAHPDLLDFTDNIRLIEGLARNDLLGKATAGQLADAYRAFRAAYHRNTLQDLPGLVSDEKFSPERELVTAVWRRLMEQEGESAAT